MTIHVVRSGETLWSIAQAAGLDPRRLAAENAVPPSGALAVGQTLVLRFPKEFYSVRPGDTLQQISQETGVPLRTLWQNNWTLGGGTLIFPGDSLVLSYQEEPTASALLNGYAYPGISRALLNQQLPYLSCLTPFTHGIAQDGSLLFPADTPLLRSARTHSVSPVLHLSTLTEDGSFDTARAIQVLSNPEMQDQLIADLLVRMEQQGYAGLDVDFEYLPQSYAQAYAAFLGQLRRLLMPQGKFLWAALAPKTRADQPGLLYEGHDYAAVGAAADAVLLMTYEWGYTAGPPMAVAPLPNVRNVLDYALTEIPPEKILLGIPNYGYDWTLPFRPGITRAQSLSNQSAIDLAIRQGAEIHYDSSAQAPFFHYTAENGTSHEVWFEDARSLAAKFRLIEEYGLLGSGIWNLMRPFSQTWLTAASLYQIR